MIKHLTIMIALALSMCTPAHAARGGVSTACLPAQLKNALAHIRANYGRVVVVSAHRPGARVAGTGKRSKHASCKAVDFHVRGNRAGALAWLRRQPLEIITYGGAMHHIHIATGNYRGHHVVNSRGRRTGGTRHARGPGAPVVKASVNRRAPSLMMFLTGGA